MTTRNNDRPGGILAPNTLRFTVGYANHGPRMALAQCQFTGREPRNCLFFHEDYYRLQATFDAASSGQEDARLGSRRRYRQEAAIARATIAQLGWDLTAEEEDLLGAIEAYGREHAAERAAA